MSRTASRTSNVAILAHYRKPMKHPVLVELLNHWEDLRDGRTAPKRSEIDPRKIETALSFAFILENVPPAPARFRIAGMALCDMIGMELRGMPSHTLIDLADRDRFSELIDGLFRDPEIVELTLGLAEKPEARSAEMLLLPMMNDRGQIARILGALVSDHVAGANPFRFRIEKEMRTRIVARAAEVPRTAPGFAEASRDFDPAPRASGQQRPYLRLVDQDKK